jgi:TatD DNase family protein
MVETDCPYLAPVPHRGKTNEPAFVRFIAEFVARLRNMAPLELAAATTDNFFTLFPRAHRHQDASTLHDDGNGGRV